MDNTVRNHSFMADKLALSVGNPFDAYTAKRRFDLIRQHGSGKRVLDLCCGTGTYLLPCLNELSSAVALDFNPELLNSLRISAGSATNLEIVEADARAIPLDSHSIDFAFSYASLYYVEDLDQVFKEVVRVLKPGGIAALEIGSFWSLNTLYSYLWHKEKNWARPRHISLNKLKRILRWLPVDLEDWESSQIIPLYRPPTLLLPLYPFTGSHWKWLLGQAVAGKSIDSWLSGLPLIKNLAFRHRLVLRKRA